MVKVSIVDGSRVTTSQSYQHQLLRGSCPYRTVAYNRSLPEGGHRHGDQSVVNWKYWHQLPTASTSMIGSFGKKLNDDASSPTFSGHIRSVRIRGTLPEVIGGGNGQGSGPCHDLFG
jgi:hypothetical protein